MSECGERVVVTLGQYRCDDGTEVGPGDVGHVVGHMGLDHAVVHFDNDGTGTVADIPEARLRVLTPQRQGR
jgi:hypothetical protein